MHAMPDALWHKDRLAGLQGNFLGTAAFIKRESSRACDEVDELVSVEMALALVP